MKIIFAASASEVMLKSGINFKIRQPEKDVDKHDCSLTVAVLIHPTEFQRLDTSARTQFKHFNLFPVTQLCTELRLSGDPGLRHDRVR